MSFSSSPQYLIAATSKNRFVSLVLQDIFKLDAMANNIFTKNKYTICDTFYFIQFLINTYAVVHNNSYNHLNASEVVKDYANCMEVLLTRYYCIPPEMQNHLFQDRLDVYSQIIDSVQPDTNGNMQQYLMTAVHAFAVFLSVDHSSAINMPIDEYLNDNSSVDMYLEEIGPDMRESIYNTALEFAASVSEIFKKALSNYEARIFHQNQQQKNPPQQKKEKNVFVSLFTTTFFVALFLFILYLFKK